MIQKVFQIFVFLVRRRSGRVCAQIRPGGQGEAVHVVLDEPVVEHAGNILLCIRIWIILFFDSIWTILIQPRLPLDIPLWNAWNVFVLNQN